jgi:hypothetical protein
VTVDDEQPVSAHFAVPCVLIKVLDPVRPSTLFVHLLCVVAGTQSCGSTRPSNQFDSSKRPATMMNGGMAQPRALAPWITGTHSGLPDCATRALDRSRSAFVTTMQLEIMPIMKPVSSKLNTSSSPMPYFVCVSSTSLNQSPISRGSSHWAL